MRFAPDELALLEESEEIEIDTARPDGPTHRTIIWVVADGDDVFIRSVNGATARWYREALADPTITVHVGGRSIPARVEPAADPDSVRRTSDQLARKYARQRASMRAMLEPHTLETTLRVVPA